MSKNGKLTEEEAKKRRKVAYEEITTHEVTDSDGNTRIERVNKTKVHEYNLEPDYIKIYTKMWLEFNEIPLRYHTLFLSLAMRMSYASTADPIGGQTVFTGSPNRESIMQECGWKSRNMYQKGLQALTNAGAIRRLSRGFYQINPDYAGKGTWFYDSKKYSGGIKDLVATFDFVKHKTTVDASYVTTGKPEDAEFDESMRELHGGFEEDSDMRNNKHNTLIVTEASKETDSFDDDEREVM